MLSFYFILLSIFSLQYGKGSQIITSTNPNSVHNYVTILGCVELSNELNSDINIFECDDNVQKSYDDDIVEKNEIIHLEPVEINEIFENNILRGSSSSYTWGKDRINQIKTQLDGKTWHNGGSGQGAFVYVIDSGIDVSHPSFEGRAKFLKNFHPDGSQTDCSSHGTHVAGTIISKDYGVAPKAEAYALRVFSCDGSGSFSAILQAINFAIEHARQNGGSQRIRRSIINMSLGGSRSQAVNKAVEDATKIGIHVVVAAGNSGRDACEVSPASAFSAITVAASTENDDTPYWSNHGRCVDIIAPGQNIMSTLPGNKNGYMSGTSMAAPHVAGVMAIILSKRLSKEDSYTPWQLSNSLKFLSVKNKITNFLTPLKWGNKLLNLPARWKFENSGNNCSIYKKSKIWCQMLIEDFY